MPAPSKNFTVIPDTDIDPDSPWTTGLVTDFRDNIEHLEEWLGKNFTAAVDHDHDDVNSKSLSSVDGLIHYVNKTDEETTEDTETSTANPPVGEELVLKSGYLFVPKGTPKIALSARIKMTHTNTAHNFDMFIRINGAAGPESSYEDIAGTYGLILTATGADGSTLTDSMRTYDVIAEMIGTTGPGTTTVYLTDYIIHSSST